MKTRKRDSARVAPPLPTHRWIWYGTGLAALAVLFWVYGPDMHTGFLFDDSKQQFALPTASQPLAAWIGRVRPALMFSYWVNSRISLEDTFSYHLFNILIHALTGVFVFLVIRRLLEWAGVEKASPPLWGRRITRKTKTPVSAWIRILNR